MTNTQLNLVHKALVARGINTMSKRKIKELVIGNPMIADDATIQEIAQMIYDHLEDMENKSEGQSCPWRK
jgi:hypothetical protein